MSFFSLQNEQPLLKNSCTKIYRYKDFKNKQQFLLLINDVSMKAELMKQKKAVPNYGTAFLSLYKIDVYFTIAVKEALSKYLINSRSDAALDFNEPSFAKASFKLETITSNLS